MKNLTKLVMLGLLLIPFAAFINLGNAYAETVEIKISAGSSTPGCEADNSCWDPSELEVTVGTTVKWTNKDSAGHTVTSGKPGDADSGALFDSTKDPAGFLIKPETSWEHTFDTVGEYHYFCQVHPHMIGEIIVKEGGTPPPPPPPEGLRLTTDNGSVDVVVNIDKGMIHGSELMVDPPQEVTFTIAFLDAKTGQPIEHVNYQFHVADESGAMVAHEMKNHSMGGTESKSVAFSNTGSYTLMVVVEGTGTSEPYDTKYSGTASTMIAVTPEFPLGVMAIMAAVVGIGIAAARFNKPLKL
jgi:plastocyanin